MFAKFSSSDQLCGSTISSGLKAVYGSACSGTEFCWSLWDIEASTPIGMWSLHICRKVLYQETSHREVLHVRVLIQYVSIYIKPSGITEYGIWALQLSD